jgi:hypothetical protein
MLSFTGCWVSVTQKEGISEMAMKKAVKITLIVESG